MYIYNKESDQMKELAFNDYVKPLLVDDKYIITRTVNSNNILIYDINERKNLFDEKLMEAVETDSYGSFRFRYAQIKENIIKILTYAKSIKENKIITLLIEFNLNEKKLQIKKEIDFIIHSKKNNDGIHKKNAYMFNKQNNYYYILK